MRVSAPRSRQSFWLLFGRIFASVGVLFLVLSIGFALTRRDLVNNGLRTQGEVIDLIAITNERDGNTTGWTWHPKVRFVDETDRTITFISSSGSKPAAYATGEQVEVLYRKGKPHNAVIHSFFSLWGMAIVFGGLGLLASIIGVPCIAAGMRAKRRAQELTTNGTFVDSDFTAIERISDDDGVHFLVRSQWLSPSDHQMHVFESEPLQFDPSAFVSPGQRIRVRIDLHNPSNYQMNMGFLPTQAKG